MKALTLWQPWASLIALGVKTIETRSWAAPKSLIGQRIAIHASKRGLPVGGIRLPKKYTYTDADREGWLAINTITDPAYQGLQPCNPLTGRQRHIPNRAQTPTLMWPHAGPHHRPRADKPEFTHIEYLPLGAVVTTARLVDCVPMIDAHDPIPMLGGFVYVDPDFIQIHTDADDSAPTYIEDQFAYGDYRSGRWAWLLDDNEPLGEPIPATGRQGIWEWTQ